MSRSICLGLLMLLMPSLAGGNEKPLIDSLTVHARSYLFGRDSDQSFEIEECQIDGLWDAMQIQILHVRLRDDKGEIVDSVYLVFQNGKLERLTSAFSLSVFSLFELTSAVVVGGQLYISYSDSLPASALPLECLVRVSMEDGILQSCQLLRDGDPMRPMLLLEKNGCVQVQTGEFESLNR